MIARFTSTVLVGGVVLIALSGLSGCANKVARARAVPPPRWSTEDGKQEVRLEIAEKMLGLGHAHDAQALLRLAREDGVTGPEIDFLQGRALYQEGLTTEAEQMLLRAREKLPRDARIYRTLGLLYAETGRAELAMSTLTRALDLDETDAATWNNLGFLQFSQQQYAPAITSMRHAVSYDGTNARYRTNLGFALFQNGETSAAWDMFSAAGPPADAWYNLALARELHGDLSGAQTGYDKSISINPSHKQAAEAILRLNAQTDPAPGLETP